MSGYQQRIQGMDRLLRIRRMRRAVYAALLVLTAVLMYARAVGEGASVKPIFIPLDGVLEVGLIMGLIGTLLGLYLKNLEIDRAQTDSQRYLMSRYSMSRAATTACIALALGLLLVLPITASGLASSLASPPQTLSLSPGHTQSWDFGSPDAFGITFVRTIHVDVTAGTLQATLTRNNQPAPPETVTAPASLDLNVQPNGWTGPANWSISFHNASPTTTLTFTFSMPLGIMPSLFSTVPFLFFLYVAANMGWWFGLRPIRDRTKSAALYAGTATATQPDMGERAYLEYAMQPTPQAWPVADPWQPPPPPPSPMPPPPPEVVAVAPSAAVARLEPRPMPVEADALETAMTKGDTLMTILQYPSAIAAYDEALRLAPNHVPALMAKARAFRAMNQDADALDAYRRALVIDPHNEDALRGSATILALQARWRESLETVETFLAQRPNDVWALELKGDVLTSLGRRPEALAAFEAAQALDPKNENVRQKIEEVRVDVPGLLSRALIASASGNYPQALNLFDEILEVDPGNVNALIGKAVAYRRSGKPQEALNCLDLVLRIQPTNASALLNRGNLLLGTGDVESALEVFDRLVSVSPQDEEGWAGQAEVYLRMGRDDDALRAFSEALKLNPGDEDIQHKIHELEATRSVHADVLQDLYTIKGVGPARAKALLDAGFRTAEDFRHATVEQLAAVKGITKRIAEDLVKHFKPAPLVTAAS